MSFFLTYDNINQCQGAITMLDIIFETLLDTLKILPFLFIAFLIIELIEHKYNNKSKKIIEKSNKLGPLIGGLLGCFPQCGFSVLATNLYITRIISLGTLISIYLTTSDEMLPILLSSGANLKTIITIITIKLLIGITIGFLIDIIIHKKEPIKINELCQEEHCHCETSIIKSSLTHTLNILIFILIINFLLNTVMHYGGKDILTNLFNKNTLLTPFIASLIGLIPNCAASVIITELYLNNVLTFSSTIAGLLTGSGIALIVLFKSNKNIKENLKIILIIYLVGSLSGITLELISFLL